MLRQEVEELGPGWSLGMLNDGTGFFGPLFAWLDDLLREAEDIGDTLRAFWDVELVPSAEPPGRLPG